MARPIKYSRGQQLATLLLSNKCFSTPPQGASGARTTSNGRAPGTRHVTAAHRRPGRSSPNFNTHRTTNATIRPPTVPRVNMTYGYRRIHQDLPRDSRNLY
jgi:hypothetical protein